MKNENNVFVSMEKEPARKNLFIIKFPEEIKIDSDVIQKCSSPSMVIDNGSYKWNDIKMEFIDLLMGNPVREGLIRLMECFKNKSDEDFLITIEMLDPTGVTVSKWTIDVLSINFIDFGDMDYSNSGLKICTLTLTPKTCTLD
jgi:hypothetical protein